MKIKTALKLIGAALAAIIIIAALSSNFGHNGSAVLNITVGSYAPDYGFYLANLTPTNLSSFKGHTTLVWFVATWCSSCAQGNVAINQNYQFFKQHGVTIVELELYKDLGYNGPPIAGFVNTYAPSAYSNGIIVPALAGYNMTAAYDPHGYLDIYYLISGEGKVLYISGSPASTLGQLAQAINESV